MKKLFVYALAVGMFTACSQDETIEMQSPMQISFEGAYVGNATRAAEDPSFHNTSNPLKAFDVWGFMSEATGKVFVDEDVKKGDDDKWTYENTQYWTPDRTYYFAALAPMESKNVTEAIADGEDAKYGLGTITFTNEKGKEDLLYAATTVTTGSSITKPEPVKFEFSHLLSKVKFSFTNAFKNSNAYIKVTNIKMDVPKTAKINLAQADWWSTNKWCDYENSTTLYFGNMEDEKVSINKSTECQFERLTFPTTDKIYTVTFYVELYYGDILAYSSSLSTTIKNVVLEMGKAYNFHAKINPENIVPGDGADDKLYPIEFTASVKEWEDGNGYNGGDISTGSVPQN